jgi:hypothetical protein
MLKSVGAHVSLPFYGERYETMFHGQCDLCRAISNALDYEMRRIPLWKVKIVDGVERLFRELRLERLEDCLHLFIGKPRGNGWIPVKKFYLSVPAGMGSKGVYSVPEG